MLRNMTPETKPTLGTHSETPKHAPELDPNLSGTRPGTPERNLTRFAQTRHNLPEACPEPGPNLPPSPSPNLPQTTYSPIQQ